jgi:hypothetical protein
MTAKTISAIKMSLKAALRAFPACFMPPEGKVSYGLAKG